MLATKIKLSNNSIIFCLNSDIQAKGGNITQENLSNIYLISLNYPRLKFSNQNLKNFLFISKFKLL